MLEQKWTEYKQLTCLQAHQQEPCGSVAQSEKEMKSESPQSHGACIIQA